MITMIINILITSTVNKQLPESSLVPRPVRVIRVTKGGLEPSAIANFPDKLDR